jgi:hypothetical protein
MARDTRKNASLKGGAAVRAKKAPGTRAKGPTKADGRAAEGRSTPAAGTVERAREYSEIYDKWRQGFDTTTLAAEYKPAKRRIQQIVNELRAAAEEAVEIHDPLYALSYTRDLVVQLEYAITQAAKILEAAMASGNLSVALGATRRVAEARKQLLEMRQIRGQLPRDLSYIGDERSLREFVEGVIEVMDRNGISMEIREEIIREAGLHQLRVGGRVELDPPAEVYPRSEPRRGMEADDRPREKPDLSDRRAPRSPPST